jgi:hypothetical protein
MCQNPPLCRNPWYSSYSFPYKKLLMHHHRLFAGLPSAVDNALLFSKKHTWSEFDQNADTLEFIDVCSLRCHLLRPTPQTFRYFLRVCKRSLLIKLPERKVPRALQFVPQQIFVKSSCYLHVVERLSASTAVTAEFVCWARAANTFILSDIRAVKAAEDIEY